MFAVPIVIGSRVAKFHSKYKLRGFVSLREINDMKIYDL